MHIIKLNNKYIETSFLPNCKNYYFNNIYKAI